MVYDHNGKNLFWRNFNPEEITMLNNYSLVDGEDPEYPPMWKTEYLFCANGLDCDGVPTFSHGTADNIYNGKSDMTDFEPLTVKVVNYWFGWFLYNLQNNELIFTSL